MATWLACACACVAFRECVAWLAVDTPLPSPRTVMLSCLLNRLPPVEWPSSSQVPSCCVWSPSSCMRVPLVPPVVTCTLKTVRSVCSSSSSTAALSSDSLAHTLMLTHSTTCIQLVCPAVTLSCYYTITITSYISISTRVIPGFHWMGCSNDMVVH